MRLLLVSAATTVHHLVLSALKPFLDSRRLIQISKNLPRIVRLHSSRDFDIAFRTARKLSTVLNNQNICFTTSLTLFWLGDEKTRIHFSLDEALTGHAWIERDQLIYTTDRSEDHRTFYSEGRL